MVNKTPNKQEAVAAGNGENNKNLFSPRFRSVAAMAGWDEEALLIASLVVEDTPDRLFKHKRRSDLQSFKTPPTNSRRRRKAQRRSPAAPPIAVPVLDLEEDESIPKQESERINITIEEQKNEVSSSIAELNCIDIKKDLDEDASILKQESQKTEKEVGGGKNRGDGISSSTGAIPCIDKLRDELSCAICLEICYEPSTTPCGHSFCKKCLSCAADKCGKKCPKCRQLISNSRYCTVNTVLWNTIQLLFPQEVESRKAAVESHGRITPQARSRRNRGVIASLNSPELNSSSSRNRRRRAARREVVVAGQDEDAALALRLQREEFMEAFGGSGGGRNRDINMNNSVAATTRSGENNRNRNSVAVAAARRRGGGENRNNSSISLSVARSNLRAMASRAFNIRNSRGPTN